MSSSINASASSSSSSVTSGFYLLVTGQIDACQMYGYDNLYVKYSYQKGPDWSTLAGVEHGVSQIARRSSGVSSSTGGDTLTWNYPLDIMFRSSNVFGWPQLVIGVYGLTMFGSDVVRGYGCTHLPTIPGRYTKYIQLYTPISSSFCQRVTAYLTNNPPEFFDPKFIAQGKGREVTRVRSHGCVKVTFNVTTKNMNAWGYQVGAERTGDMLVAQAQLNASAQAASSSSATAAAINSRLPAKTSLSAATTAGIAAQQAARTKSLASSSSAAGLNPPSGSNSRENSVIRRRGAAGGAAAVAAGAGVEEEDDDEEESKYSSQPLISQPSSGVEMQGMTVQGGGAFGRTSSKREF